MTRDFDHIAKAMLDAVPGVPSFELLKGLAVAVNAAFVTLDMPRDEQLELFDKWSAMVRDELEQSPRLPLSRPADS